MKKIIFGLVLLSMFSLSACGNNEKKETSSSSKVEQLESRVKELESSSSSSSEKENASQADRSKDEILSELKSDTNKKIVSAFLDAGLKPYNYSYEGVSEMLELPSDVQRPIYESGLSFYIEKGTDGVILATENYPDEQSMNEAADYFSKSVDTPTVVKNNTLHSILYGSPSTNSEKELFNKYKDVFENIK